MNVILIDDEELALNYLEYRLSELPDIRIVGKYKDPDAGKAHAVSDSVDVVFLDIHLNQINGLELAEQILESKPSSNVVFVTAHSDYAIQAFELHAFDYILKPVGKDRLAKTLQRVRERIGERAPMAEATSESVPQELRLRLFQQVGIETEGQLAPFRWRTTRAQELFLYVLQHRGQLVRKSALVDLLWPEFEPAKAYSQLYTAIYHIRKTLEPFSDHIRLSNATDGYMMTLENVSLDVDEWETQVTALGPLTEGTVQDYEKLVGRYPGDYLQDFEYWWAESERYRLSMLWFQKAVQMAEWYASHGRRDLAADKYHELCSLQPQAEEIHYALMKLYDAMDNHVAVHRQYRTLQKNLMEELNEQPSPYIREWYQAWSLSNKE